LILRRTGYIALAMLFVIVSWAEPILGVLEFLIVTAVAVAIADS
jgi:hypothetical protein